MTGVADRHIQVVSWLVLLLATSAFFVLLVGAPWLGYRYVKNATVEETAEAECKEGSCSLTIGASDLVVRPDDGAVTVREGHVFATDAGSSGLIRFVEDSTVNLEPNTAVELRTLRRPRFRLSEDVRRIAFRAEPSSPGTSGGVRMGTTWSGSAYTAESPHGTIDVLPESRAWMDLDASLMRVRVNEGQVRVTSGGVAVALERDERTEVRAGSPPDEPQEALVNIVEGGSFERPPRESGWLYRTHIPGNGRDQDQPQWGGRRVLQDGRSVLHIERSGSESRPADVIYEKQLGDSDVSGAAVLEVRGQLRVLDQSLPLGGERGTELPLILNLVYEAEDGGQYGWSAGFYATEPGPDEPPGKYVLSDVDINVNTRVPLGEWVAYSSGNLLNSQNPSSFESFGWPRPKRLLRLEIISSGHDYASDVDDIAVWVK